MKKHLLVLLLPAMSFFLQSCFIFGVHMHLHQADKNSYKKKYRRNKIKKEQELYIDTTYTGLIRRLYRYDKSARHDHFQPVQYLLFDRLGNQVSYMINCDAHTNVLLYANWNYEHRFDTFPTQTMPLNDRLLKLTDILQTVKDTSGHFVKPDSTFDYTELVFFNSALYRASKELIRTVKRQDKKGYHVKTMYVNSDNIVLWNNADTATKRKIRENYTDLQ